MVLLKGNVANAGMINLPRLMLGTCSQLKIINAPNLSLYSYVELISKLGSCPFTCLILISCGASFFGDVRFYLQ